MTESLVSENIVIYLETMFALVILCVFITYVQGLKFKR